MANYDDESHITGNLTAEQVAEAVLHKKYGVDVRKAIAQGFGLCATYEDIKQMRDDLSNAQRDIKTLQSRLDQVEAAQKKLDNLKNAVDKLNAAVFGTDSVSVDYSEITEKEEKNKAQEVNLD